MKHRYWLTILVVAIITSFYAGRGIQHLQSGRYYKVYNEEIHQSKFGPISFRHELDRVGLPFLDGEFSTIALKTGFGDVIIYKAQVGFQETYPHVQRIDISDDLLSWKDGWCRYELRLSPLPNHYEKNLAIPKVPEISLPDDPPRQE